MKIIEKNKGRYLTYELRDDLCIFENGELTVDLNGEQCGADKTIDISIDENGKLVYGEAGWYAAQIKIPAKTYTIRENGIADEMGFRQIVKTANPINTEEVTLILWALEV